MSVKPDSNDGTNIRLRVGDWISVMSRDAGETAHFKVIDADYWPRVKVAAAVYMCLQNKIFDKEYSLHNEQIPVSVSINSYPFDDLSDHEKRVSIVQLLNTLPSVNEMKEWLEKNTNIGEEALLSSWRNRISLSACNLLRWIIASNRSKLFFSPAIIDAKPRLPGCIVQIDETPTDYDNNAIPPSPVPVESPIKKLHSGEERVYGMNDWLQFR